MRILLSNDDGASAPGLMALYQALSTLAEVTVVAPDGNRSGASSSLTLDRPLLVQKDDNGFFRVNGTPTDCVHLALRGLLDFKPDLVFSGINYGANMGEDTLYSGTVAAATEGYLHGIPSFALSMANYPVRHFSTGAAVAKALVERWVKAPASEPWLLNVNIPDVPLAELKGYHTTRLGKRHAAEPIIEARSPYGVKMYWIGKAGPAADAGEGTDFFATENGYVSMTPLCVDQTRYDQIADVRAWQP